MVTRYRLTPEGIRVHRGDCRGWRDCLAKYQRQIGIALLGAVGMGLWWHESRPDPSLLSFRVGQSFEEVVRSSTFPVLKHSALPARSPTLFGSTYVTEPAVTIRFDDPEHGFTLPPTNFAALTYQHNIAAVLATSPMLEPLAFDDAVAVLENLQNQFKAGGWQPWLLNGSTWFDLTLEGKQRLYARMFEPGYMHTANLRIPKKYGMTFRLKCAEGCRTRTPPYRFLIDVGVSDDIEGWQPGDPVVWDKAHPAAPLPSEQSSRGLAPGLSL